MAGAPGEQFLAIENHPTAARLAADHVLDVVRRKDIRRYEAE